MNPVATASPSLWDKINSGISGLTSTMSSVYSARIQLQNLKNAQAAGQSQQFMNNLPQLAAPAIASNYSAATVAATPPKNNTMLYVGIGAVVLLVGALLMRRK